MKVLCVGGGSGGHVTPVLAVINELSELDPTLEVMFVCDAAFETQSRGLMQHAKVSVPVRVISAGKLRRYHGVPLWKQALDLPTVAKNIADMGKIVAGFWQSVRILRDFKPDVVFAKGGYVCLPMGYAAKFLSIPLVIHDSDTRPGMTNKALAGFAARIATGSPLENYNYDLEKSTYTGVPIDAAFHPFTPEEQRSAKAEIGVVDLDKPLIVVTGGGLGAASINEGIVAAADSLLGKGFSVYHVSGKRQYKQLHDQVPARADYQLVEFVYKDMATVLGAADIVISRASATFLQELAALAKPTIIVPAAHLGDQVKNAEVYAAAEAGVVLDDATVRNGAALAAAVDDLWNDASRREAISKAFHAFAKPDAAHEVARLISETGKEVEG